MHSPAPARSEETLQRGWMAVSRGGDWHMALGEKRVRGRWGKRWGWRGGIVTWEVPGKDSAPECFPLVWRWGLDSPHAMGSTGIFFG